MTSLCVDTLRLQEDFFCLISFGTDGDPMEGGLLARYTDEELSMIMYDGGRVKRPNCICLGQVVQW